MKSYLVCKSHPEMIFLNSIKHPLDEVLSLENDNNEIKERDAIEKWVERFRKRNRSGNWKVQEFYEVLEM